MSNKWESPIATVDGEAWYAFRPIMNAVGPLISPERMRKQLEQKLPGSVRVLKPNLPHVKPSIPQLAISPAGVEWVTKLITSKIASKRA